MREKFQLFFYIYFTKDTKNKEFLKIDPHQCLRVYEKLLGIEKKFLSSTKSTKIATESTASLDNMDNKRSIGEIDIF